MKMKGPCPRPGGATGQDGHLRESADGAAVQNMNLILGIEESTGLVL